MITDPARPRTQYFRSKLDGDTFPDPFLIETEANEADDATCSIFITTMLNYTKENSFPEEHWDDYQKLIWITQPIFSQLSFQSLLKLAAFA